MPKLTPDTQNTNTAGAAFSHIGKAAFFFEIYREYNWYILNNLHQAITHSFILPITGIFQNKIGVSLFFSLNAQIHDSRQTFNTRRVLLHRKTGD